MSIAITSRDGGSQSGITSYTVTFASAPTAGQLLVVVFRRDGGAAITAPPGWVEHAGPFDAGFSAYVYAKIAGASEPASHVWGLASATNASHRHFVIDGFTGPIDTDNLRVGGAYFASTSTPDPPVVFLPSVPSIPANQFVGIGLAVWDSGGATLSSYPSGYVNGDNHTSHSGVNIASAEFLGDEFTLYSQVNPGPFTLSAARRSLGITIAALAGAAPATNNGSAGITEGVDSTSTTAVAIATGSGAITEGLDTSSTTAVAIATGSAAVSEQDDTSASTAVAIQTGSAGITEQDDTSVSTAIALQTGSAAIVEQDDTSASVAVAIQTGSAAVNEQADTSSTSAVAIQAGSASIAEQADTLSATAIVVQSGSAAVTEQPDAVSAATTVTQFGSGAIVEQPDEASSVSGTIQTGSAAIAEQADTTATTAIVIQLGSAAITEQDDTSTTTAVITVSGSAAITEQSDTPSSSSSSGVTGSANITEQTDSPSSAANAIATGSASITEAADTSQSSAEGGTILGSASITELSDSSSSGFVNTGSANLDEGGDSSTSPASGTPGAGPMKCCCPEECHGCCFPYDYLEPPDVMEAGNYAQILRWEIDAPNCPSLDGTTGQFSPETTGPHDPMVFCGFCLCYVNTDAVKTIGPFSAWQDNGLGDCTATPCSMTLCFGLQCARTRPVNNLEECCNQFRLVVVFIGAVPDGGELVDTSSQCFEGEGIGGNANFPGCNITSDFPEDIARELAPSSCQCEDNEATPPVPFELVFDLSELSIICPEGNFGPGHPCEGLTRCCDITDCSFVDATVTVTRL